MNDALIQKIKTCPSLPTLPTIAVQVLDLAQKSDADISEIARLISKDPALSTKILRTVNSSFYGRAQAVSTISHALVILGLQSVKTLVLGFSLVSNLAKNKTKGFKHLTYWKRSIYAATAARVLAAKLGVVQQEEAFLCGLLEDIGMLVLDLIEGDAYGKLHEQVQSHSALAERELAELGMTHADVGGILAEQWHLPPLLCAPIAHHHAVETVSDPGLKKLTQVVSLAGACADVFIDEPAAQAIAYVRQVLKDQCNLGEADCDSLLAEIGKKTKEMAGLFEINIGSALEYEAILKKANEALVTLTLETQMQATQLQQKNQQLMQQATQDGLTGLANRAAFDQFLQAQFSKALSGATRLSLILIDLDHFKQVNDKHGHQAGDAVLIGVGRLLRAAARKSDLAARYGGEEMALILPGSSRTEASTIAETIRRALAARPIKTPSEPLQATASFGVASVEPGSVLKLPAHLIKAADLALYHAKKGGRNCVRVFTPAPSAKAA